MTTLGRPDSFRSAYQAALHALAQMTAERDALKVAVNFEAVQRDMRHKAWLEEKARADAAEAELDAARSEILTLRARLGNIADLTTMPMPPDWAKKEGTL